MCLSLFPSLSLSLVRPFILFVRLVAKSNRTSIKILYSVTKNHIELDYFDSRINDSVIYRATICNPKPIIPAKWSTFFVAALLLFSLKRDGIFAKMNLLLSIELSSYLLCMCVCFQLKLVTHMVYSFLLCVHFNLGVSSKLDFIQSFLFDFQNFSTVSR